ncbi:MAG TPA: response regulator [Opitutaceae bacterium]|nr:response regulator [Opitutaceae bacterium]
MAQRAILVVDDEDLMRSTLQTTLSEAGYRVVTAADGKAAVEAVNRERFDAVLTDLFMPEMDGIELITDLKKTHADIPVIAMFHRGHFRSKENLKFARLLGARAILPKPFSNEQLLISLAFVLPEHPY